MPLEKHFASSVPGQDKQMTSFGTQTTYSTSSAMMMTQNPDGHECAEAKDLLNHLETLFAAGLLKP